MVRNRRYRDWQTIFNFFVFQPSKMKIVQLRRSKSGLTNISNSRKIEYDCSCSIQLAKLSMTSTKIFKRDYILLETFMLESSTRSWKGFNLWCIETFRTSIRTFQLNENWLTSNFPTLLFQLPFQTTCIPFKTYLSQKP